MRAVVQRVKRARVTVYEGDNGIGVVTGEIGAGLMVLLGVGRGDTEADLDVLINKLVNLRIFEDDAGRMNLSALDVGAAVLVVSQFTLYADTRKGRRPSFVEAAPPDIAAPLCALFLERLRAADVAQVESGRFQAEMDVELVNAGPVTILLDSATLR